MANRLLTARNAFWLLAVASVVLHASVTVAEDTHLSEGDAAEFKVAAPEIAQCGCGNGNCRVVCECKEEKKTVWVVECEPFCPVLPKLPSLWPWGKKCHGGCGCPDCGACGPPAYCGKPRVVKKLVKKEVRVCVPRYRCVCPASGYGAAIPSNGFGPAEGVTGALPPEEAAMPASPGLRPQPGSLRPIPLPLDGESVLPPPSESTDPPSRSRFLDEE